MGQYREKNCKYCEKPFRKQGVFCSKACSNSNRPVSDRVRENMKEVAEDYNKTPAALAKQSMLHTSLQGLTMDDFAVEIPEFYELPEGYTPDF
jgi:hypothetical protein